MNKQALIFLTIMAGWINRKQQQVIDYLLEENRILKEHLDAYEKKLRLTASQRRSLAKKGRKIGWEKLQEFANIVRPETILVWHRKLVALKYTAKRLSRTPRRKRMDEIRELCVKLATDEQD